MASEWLPDEFGALMSVPSRNGIHKGIPFQGHGVPIVKMGEVYHVDVIKDQTRDLLDLTPEELDRLEVRSGDLLFCRTSLVAEGVGHCAMVGNLSKRSTFASNLIRVRLNTKKADPRFWFYYFRSPIGNEQLLSLARGTSVTTITGPDISALNVLVPEINEQRTIAHILGTLDDKSELNRRMNETLEAMARALFKSWFVDFDPVRAKAESRAPGMPKPLADLFPESFEDSILGVIPKGWRVRRFADTVDIIGGGTPKTSVSEYWDGDIPWFSVVDAPSNYEVWVIDTAKKITREGVANSSTRVLPVGTTIISARGTVGRIALVAIPMAMNQSCYGLRGKVGARGFFTYYATQELVVRLQQHAHGSVFDTITQDTLAGIYLAMPPAELVEAFEARVGPFLERIFASLFESRSLAALRDTLLPKLISGEIRIQNIDHSDLRVA